MVRIAVIALLLGLPDVAFALEPDRPLDQYGVRNWTSRDGLPQNTVAAIAQTPDGYLWFGTQGGLARFDGSNIVRVDGRVGPDIAIGWAMALLTDRNGALWIATKADGLFVYRDGTFERFAKADGLPTDRIKTLAEDDQGRLWIGTEAGLRRLQQGRIVTSGVASLDAALISVLLPAESTGAMWVGTHDGLVLVEDDRHQTFTVADGLPHNRVSSLASRDGRLWVGTYGGGIRVFDGDEFTSEAGPLSEGFVFALEADEQGVIWAGAPGLHRLEGDRWVAGMGIPDGLISDQIQSLFADRDGSLWAGTLAEGVFQLYERDFLSYSTRQGLPTPEVMTFFEDSAGTMWLGHRSGVSRMLDGKIEYYGASDGLPDEPITSIAEMPQGVMWFGTFGGGVARLERGGVRAITAADGLGADLVMALHTDRSSRLWIATLGGGVSVMEGGKLRTISTRDGLPGDEIRFVREDRQGRIWIGTKTAGIAHFSADGTDIVSYSAADGLAGDDVSAIYEDPDGSFWFGTDRGLSRLIAGRFQNLTPRDGLPHQNIHAIVEDDAGRLWLSANEGVWRMDKAEILGFFRGETPDVTSVSYGGDDGLGELYGGYQPAVWKDRHGRLWFPTTEGAVVFDPAAIKAHPPTSVVIESVTIDGQPSPVDDVTISPNSKRVEIRYTAPVFLSAQKIRYRYRLEGFEDRWVVAERRRLASYTSIPPGSYRFRVQASEPDGRFRGEGASIGLVRDPRFTETAWFSFLVVALVGSTGVAGHRLRMRRLEARERTLERLVEDRTAAITKEKARAEQALTQAETARGAAETHKREAEAQRHRAEQANQAKSAFLANMSHELRTPLNAILGFAQLLARDDSRNSRDREQISVIQRSGEHLLGLINDVLSLSKIEAGRVTIDNVVFDLHDLLEGVRLMFVSQVATKGLSFEYEVSTTVPVGVVGDAGKCRQILINILGNALKFTERGRIRLDARWESEQLAVEVRDTGPGVSAEDLDKLFQVFSQAETSVSHRQGTGLGLAISRNYARLIGGDVSLGSGPDGGALVRITLPLEIAPPEAVIERDTRVVTGLASGQSALRLLVVDDSTDSRNMLASLLQDVGFDVLVAEDGRVAVDAWSASRPNLVFMDLRMPRMDGYEAARQIRALEAAEAGPSGTESPARTVIVAVTASAFAHDRQKMLDAGCDDYIAKPFRHDAILKKIEEFLDVQYLIGERPVQQASVAAPSVSIEDLETLPEALLDELYGQLQIGDDQQALLVAEKISGEKSGLAETLSRIIRSLDFEDLMSKIEEIKA